MWFKPSTTRIHIFIWKFLDFFPFISKIPFLTQTHIHTHPHNISLIHHFDNFELLSCESEKLKKKKIQATITIYMCVCVINKVKIWRNEKKIVMNSHHHHHLFLFHKLFFFQISRRFFFLIFHHQINFSFVLLKNFFFHNSFAKTRICFFLFLFLFFVFALEKNKQSVVIFVIFFYFANIITVIQQTLFVLLFSCRNPYDDDV